MPEAPPRAIDLLVEFREGAVSLSRGIVEALEESFELRHVDADRAAFLGDDVVGALVDANDARDLVLEVGAQAIEVFPELPNRGLELVWSLIAAAPRGFVFAAGCDCTVDRLDRDLTATSGSSATLPMTMPSVTANAEMMTPESAPEPLHVSIDFRARTLA